MGVRKCKQCGMLLEERYFRKYYGGRKGLYKTCLNCEKINSRYKYLAAKNLTTTGLTDVQAEELAKVLALYDLLRANGLEPPAFGEGRQTKPLADLDEMIQRQLGKQEHVQEVAKSVGAELPSDTPKELLEWLEKDLSHFEPEELQDEIYDTLQRRYRPQIGVDPDSLVPVYDDKFRDVLNQILARFDAYEEEYYAKDTD